MKEFIQKHAAAVIGILSGFDRVLFRGTLRALMYEAGMMGYLSGASVRLTEFGRHAERVTNELRTACEGVAERAKRPVRYLESPRVSKEDLARQIASEDKIEKGLICVLKSVEPCLSYEVYRNCKEKLLQLRLKPRKCLHYYQYWMHPELGLMHARIQTWFPFTIHACVNGREWLARTLRREGIGFEKRENCFTWLEDVPRAQALMNAQLRTDWCKLLNGLAAKLNPAHGHIFKRCLLSYYWSAPQTEWATDVMFKDAGSLQQVYPWLVREAIAAFGAVDVLRFLGKRVVTESYLARFSGELTSDLKERPEGLRIRHALNGNSVKMYDKQGRVLRIETTLDNPRQFMVYRPKEGGPVDEKAWRILRNGVADMYRRAEIGQACNNRYLAKLATIEQPQALKECVDGICRPVQWKGKRVRALNPWGQDAELLTVLLHGEYDLNGFRNRDLQKHLFAKPAADKNETRRRSSRVSRLLRLLRAHQLIRKVSKTHRYVLTDAGRLTLIALRTAHNANIHKLLEAA
jgi:hypothetical protein